MSSRPPLLDLKGKRALILDDSATMRTMLRMAVQNIGVTSIDVSDTVNDALFKLVKQERRYDFILCDYILGPDRDGQQFLEELRHRKLLPYHTVFIMVTAERGYERVVNAVELAPDDYLLKPFSGELLLQRLLAQIHKKVLFIKLSKHLDAGRYADAIAEADSLLAQGVGFQCEIQRLKAEAHLELHQLDDAQAIYNHLLIGRDLPWARFGLARIAHLRNRLPEAEGLLELLVTDAPRYTAAYDLLAEVKHELDNHAGAQKILDKGVQISPRNMRRNRKLGAAALLNGDLATAERSLAAVITHGQNSALLEPGDFINQARCSLAQGKGDLAAQQAEQGLSKFPGDRAMRAAGMFLQAHSNEFAADPAKAQELVRSGLALLEALRNDDLDIPPEAALSGVDACLHAKMEAEATALANKLLQAQQARLGELRAATLTALNQSFKAAGAEQASAELMRKTREEMAEINNQAVRLAGDGQLREAMSLFKQAAAGKAASPVAIYNAARVMLMVLEKEGWEEGLAKEVSYMLNRARDKDAASPKYLELQQHWKSLLKKYGTRDPAPEISSANNLPTADDGDILAGLSL